MDPSKRATINALLNPTQVPPSFPSHLPPLGPQSSSSHAQEDPALSYAPQHPSSYSLKAANWAEEQRTKSATLSPSRQYQQHQPGGQMPSTSAIGPNYNGVNPHQPRMAQKPRPESYDSASWPTHTVQQLPSTASNMPYAALPRIYSDERTGKGFACQNI